MDCIWKKEKIDLEMTLYDVKDLGDSCGYIQVCKNSKTVSSIQVSFGGSLAAFKDNPLAEWLRSNAENEEEYQAAIRRFTKSCAAYCVATYLLGIGDRHNDNIMLNKNGRMFRKLI